MPRHQRPGEFAAPKNNWARGLGYIGSSFWEGTSGFEPKGTPFGAPLSAKSMRTGGQHGVA